MTLTSTQVHILMSIVSVCIALTLAYIGLSGKEVCILI